MNSSYLDRLEEFKKLFSAPGSPTAKTAKITNIVAREAPNAENRTAKTAKITETADCELPKAKNGAAKTAKITSSSNLGLVASWSREFGYVSIHDPGTGEWHDVQTKEAPPWALNEARRRKELCKDGNRKAFRLTSREMEELWQKEHPDTDEGIVEDYPIEVT